MLLEEQIQLINEASRLTNEKKYSEAIEKWKPLTRRISVFLDSGKYEIFWNYSICLANVDKHESALLYSIKAFFLVDTVASALKDKLNPDNEKQEILDNIRELAGKLSLPQEITTYLQTATYNDSNLPEHLEQIKQHFSRPRAAPRTLTTTFVSERLQFKALGVTTGSTSSQLQTPTPTPQTPSRKRATFEQSEARNPTSLPNAKRACQQIGTFFASPQKQIREILRPAPYEFWRERLIIERNNDLITSIIEVIPANAPNQEPCYYRHLIKNPKMSDEEVVNEIFMSLVQSEAPAP